MLTTLETCEFIARIAHKGQVDKSGAPYIEHPLTVAKGVETDDEKCVALLHDVLEDSGFTAEDLRLAKIPEHIIEAVETLTHKEGVPYDDYISAIKKNELARKVKMSDLTHNMDLSRLNEITEKDRQRKEKYERAYAVLAS